jgi:3-oxoacyl-[acyl-carrier protein] reductase
MGSADVSPGGGLGLANRRVLVTGGSRGIGAACCRAFAACGASVWVHYRERGDAAEAVLEEMGAYCGDHHACAADLRRPEAVAGMFAEVAERWGGLDVLVNNAGVWLEAPLDGDDPAVVSGVYDLTMDVNVRGAFACAREATPLLRRSGDGAIINVASTAGRRGEARYSPYAASKGAILAATKSWAVELAPIRVNAVAPGWVETDMTEDALDGDARERALEEIPLRRIATPEDIAGPVLFLASPLSRHMTAAVLDVNGGSVR